ncbi:flagellar hook-associated protein FlgL [Salsuginibacillus kocurii]|uniref:flagellar hook-associated protein FlgL n=1 Tax=Salsuginibacillus kocurii TaxID=427078 RepID=UPI00035C5D70|nr:flagellar hook-associated protein FlgL [Salsuginibacillus kocurii]
MRVTESMMANNNVRHIQNSFSKLEMNQDQLATGKKITRASQDPVVAMNGMKNRTSVTEIEQFQRNLGQAHNWMDESESALDDTTQAMHRLRELAVQASNDTYDSDERANMANEVGQLKEHIISNANARSNDKYIFNGTDTTNPPVEEVNGEVTAVSDNEDNVEFELNKGVEVPVNVNPQNVFSEELFEDLQQFEDQLRDEDTTSEELEQTMEIFDGHIDNIVSEQAELGARVNRVEMIEGRLADQEIVANRVMSDNEDADMEEVITELRTQEAVHQAALGAGARIIQPTLMDFLN